MPANHLCAYWMYNAVSRNRCDQAIAEAQEALRNIEFDSIAFTGVSGDLFGPVLAYTMKKEVLCVRKNRKETNSHSQHDVEGFAHSKKYLIVDDIVSSGSTLLRIIKEIRKMSPSAQCIGVYTYNGVDGGGDIIGFASTTNGKVAACIDLAERQIGEEIAEREEKYRKFLEACGEKNWSTSPK